MKFSFDPPFALIQTAAIALFTLAVALSLYLRRERRRDSRSSLGMAALRGAVLLGIGLLLLNPILNEQAPQSKGRTPFYLLLDSSRSMTTPDADANEPGLTRWKAAQRAVLENAPLLQTLREKYDLHVLAFDGKATATPLETLRALAAPKGDRTGLGEALQQALASGTTQRKPGQWNGGVLLVSDGRDNGFGFPLEGARMAKSLGVPIFTLCLGQERQGRDVQVIARRPQTFSAPKQTVELVAEVRMSGVQDTPLQIDLLREGRKVASRALTASSGTREIAFPVQESGKGFYRYAIASSTVSGETNATNNRANVFLNVMDSRARVLILEGYPTWDVKFLAQTLREDPTITVDTIFQLTEDRPFAIAGDAEKPTLRVPKTVADFAQYDVVMLGRGFESFFEADGVAALKAWVSERGGNLVFLRGRADERTEALRELEPFAYEPSEIENARMRLTEAGKSYPGFAFRAEEDAQMVVQRLPSLITATRVQGEKALAIVLARSGSTGGEQEMAVLAYQRYGQGKSLAIAGQGLWRWAFLPPEQAQYRQVYADFWTQTTRWLVSDSDFLPGQNIALRTDRTAYSLQETVTLLGYLRNAKPAPLPPITITQPNGRTATLTPGKAEGASADFLATFRPAQAGEYIATIPPIGNNPRALPASAAFTVYPGQEEDSNRSADPALMRQIAAASGGQALALSEVASLPERLRVAELAASGSAEPQTAWDRWWVLALLVGGLAAEWLLRRRFGLA